MTPRRLISVAATAAMLIAGVAAPHAAADAQCRPGGPPPDAATKAVDDVYGQPATLWITDLTVGISTAAGSGQADIRSASPIRRQALLVDAQRDGNHQIIVDAGREALLYAVSGCAVTPVVDQHGAPFVFDRDDRRGNGDGVGCSDLGEGRRLVGLLQLRDQQLPQVRRTEIDLNGATATIGRSDTVNATSEDDPAWTTAAEITCGDLTLARDGLAAPE